MIDGFIFSNVCNIYHPFSAPLCLDLFLNANCVTTNIIHQYDFHIYKIISSKFWRFVISQTIHAICKRSQWDKIAILFWWIRNLIFIGNKFYELKTLSIFEFYRKKDAFSCVTIILCDRSSICPLHSFVKNDSFVNIYIREVQWWYAYKSVSRIQLFFNKKK